MQAVIACARQQGHLVERLTNAEVGLHQLLPSLLDDADSEAVREALGRALLVFADRDYLTDELRGHDKASVSVVCAPCFDAAGLPELVLGVYVMEVDVPAAEIRRTVDAVRAAAGAVTRSIGGRDPWLAATD
jgi:hypothetical protein